MNKKQLLRKKRKLLKEIHEIEDFILGSVTVLKKPCTYPRCKKCASGVKHPTVYHSLKIEGKTKLTYLGNKLEPKARKWLANYRTMQALIKELSWVNLELLIKEREHE